jgi:midasin (ATPase involved in ribosome maturation)
MPFTSGFPIGDAIYDFFDGRSDETKNESFHDMMNRTNPTYRQKNEARLVSMADKGMGKPRGLGGYEELL